MDRLFDKFASGVGMPLRRIFDADMPFRLGTALTMPHPAIDVTEDAGGYRLTAELPGMTESDIEVALADDTLTVKGEKKEATETTETNYYLSERSYGSFRRSFVLPEGVDPDKIGAEFAKGVLTVTLPKVAGAAVEPKKIEVKAAA
jgi:HSP20 family protein